MIRTVHGRLIPLVRRVRSLRFALVSLFLLLGSVPCSVVQAEDVLAESVRVLRNLDRDIDLPEQKIPQLKAQFARVLAVVDDVTPDKLSENDLLAFFEAAYRVAFYSMEVPYARQMQRALDELERRHMATPKIRQQMLDRYVGARMLAEAQAFAADPVNADVERLPVIRDASSSGHLPTLWQVEDRGASVVRRDFALGAKARLIVVASPWCPFSERASKAIVDDAELNSLMARHSTWIMPQSSMPDLSVVEKWNQVHEGWPLQLVYLKSEWPMIPAWDTPGFYFIKDGKLLSAVHGWPGPEQMEKLRSGFESIGIRLRNDGRRRTVDGATPNAG